VPIALTARIFLPFAFGYLLTSIFRSINGVIAPDLVRDLGLNATELGFAISAFYLGATLLQLPYGILLDRYDPRRVFAIFLAVSGIGVVVTALAQSVPVLTVGRGLTSLGTAAAAVTSYRIHAMWFPVKKLALANGLSLGSGGLGLIAGTAPVEIALGFLDWRQIHLIIAALIAFAAILVVAITPRRAGGAGGVTLLQQILGLGTILKSAEFWRVAPMMCVTIGIFSSFSGLWAGPWLRDVAGFDDPTAANALLLIAVAMTTGGLLTGPATALAKRLGLSMMEFAVTAALLTSAVLFVIVLQWVPSFAAVALTWFSLGALATFGMVIYAAMAPKFAPQFAGRLNACLTLSWMLGSFVLQNVYGIVLDQFPSDGAHYAREGHRVGTALNLTLLVLSIGWYFVSGRIHGPAKPTSD
jgi:predicted MFS family arabinose efflux permease